LAGYVSEHSAYHHGEQSLCSTIIGLAQNFVGSNNFNLLEPKGQFGTRLQVIQLNFSLSFPVVYQCFQKNLEWLFILML